MVSFCCDHCQEIIKKPKAELHVRRCHPASLSCVDCYKTFTGTAFKAHTSCITEEQKFHGKLYKENNGKANGKQQQQQKQKQHIATKPAPAPTPAPAPAAESKKRPASAAANASSSSSDSSSSSSSSDSESDAEPAKKKAKTAEAATAAAGPSGEDVKKAVGALGEAKSVSYKDLVKRTVKAVRKAHPALGKSKAKKLVKDSIRFNVAGGKVSLA